MDRKTAGKIGGLTAHHNDPERMRANARLGGYATLKKHGPQHYVRMRSKQLDAKRRAADGS